MKSTTTIRRFDDLGRIVIPKEIRKAIGVGEGSPMEVYFDEQKGEIVLHRYSQYDSLLVSIEHALEDLRLLSGGFYISDEGREKVNRAIETLSQAYKDVKPIVYRF